MKNKRKVIIDCDPGVDDALAINALLLKEEVEVLGISCVGGNRPLEYTYKNALRLVDFFKKDVKVYKGVEPLSIDPNIKTSFFHGENGFGDVDIPYSEKNLSDVNAIDFLEEMLLKYPNEIEILALGPLSNLAALILKKPVAFKNVKAIYSMGGTFTMGNITPYCEFNYYFDLKALDIVMNFLNENKVVFHMFPLDITMKVYFDVNEFTFLRYEGGTWGNLVADIFENHYLVKTYKAIGKTYCVLHDLVAAMYMFNPELFDEVKPVKISVELKGEKRGKMSKEKADTNIYVHQDVIADKMKEAYLSINYDEKIVEKYRKLNKS